MTDKQKLALAIKTLKKVRVIAINDGCGECSNIWQNEYELKEVTKTLKALGESCETPVRKEGE